MRKIWVVFITLIVFSFVIPGLVMAGGSAPNNILPIKKSQNTFQFKENEKLYQRDEANQDENQKLQENAFLCNFGVGTCLNSEFYRKAGTILPWYELLSIAAIIFVVSEFAENSKTRLFLFHLSVLKPWMTISVAGSILLVGIANLIPLIADFNIPFISYPATYEILSLIVLSGLFLGFCAFIYKPHWFRPKFSYSTLSTMVRLLINRNDQESLSALIFLTSSYLENIIVEAAKYDYYGRKFSKESTPEPSSLTLLSRDLIDVILSSNKICSIIAREHSYFIEQFVELSTKHRLWHNHTGNIFFGNLMESLLTEDDSLLVRELKLGGVEGIYKPLLNLIFATPGILANYYPVTIFTMKSNPVSMRLITEGFKISLKFYFTTPETSIIGPDNPRLFLHGRIKGLAEATQSYCWELVDFEGKEIYKQETPQLSTVGGFFHDLQYILTSNKEDKYDPKFSQQELALEKDSVSLGIAEAIFEHFQAFCWIKNEEWARTIVLHDIYWVLFRAGSGEPIFKAIRKKVLDLIKERVEENFKNHYVSMIKMLINLYGFNLGNTPSGEVEEYFQELFNERVAEKLIKDKEFREKHLLSDWTVKRNKIYNSSNKIVYTSVTISS